MHVLQEALGIEIADQVLDWLKKESVTSVTNSLLVGSEGLAATGWPLKEVEKRAFEFLCLWWGTDTANNSVGDLDSFVRLTRDEFHCPNSVGLHTSTNQGRVSSDVCTFGISFSER